MRLRGFLASVWLLSASPALGVEPTVLDPQPEPPAEKPVGWRFGIVAEGSWSRHVVDTTTASASSLSPLQIGTTSIPSFPGLGPGSGGGLILFTPGTVEFQGSSVCEREGQTLPGCRAPAGSDGSLSSTAELSWNLLQTLVAFGENSPSATPLAASGAGASSGTCSFLTPQFCTIVSGAIGASNEERLRLKGFSGALAARVWFPVSPFGAQPWTQVGYRRAVTRFAETGEFAGLKSASGVPLFGSDLRVDYRGGAFIKLGVDLPWSPFGLPVTIAPVVGYERSAYKGTLTYRNPLSTATSRNTVHLDAGTIGLEIRTEILRTELFRLELFGGADYVYVFDGEETMHVKVGAVRLAAGVFEVEHAARANAGLILSF